MARKLVRSLFVKPSRISTYRASDINCLVGQVDSRWSQGELTRVASRGPRQYTCLFFSLYIWVTTCFDNNFANLLKHHDTCLHSYSHVLRWVRVCDVVVDHLHRIASVASLLKTIYILQFSVYSKRFHSYALWGVDCWRINLVPVVRRVGNWFCDRLQSAQPTWLMWSCWYSDVFIR